MDRDAAADLQEWELLLASPTAAATSVPYAGGREVEDDAGAIKYDYFDLDSDTRRASLSMAEEAEEGTDEEAGSAGWVEPHPDALAFPPRDRAALWSDSSSDGERREEPEATEPPPEEVAAAAEEKGPVAPAPAAPWWKLPMEVLRLWAARAARSAWSVPVAVALLGIAVLGRRLYRMRRQSRAVARVRLILDDKVRPSASCRAMLRANRLIMRRCAWVGVSLVSLVLLRHCVVYHF
jgi:hypothetical protein